MTSLSEFVLFEYQLMHPHLDGEMLIEVMLEQLKKSFKHYQLINSLDPSLILQALSHRSFVNEMRIDLEDYERLEFLGDAALDLFVSEKLIEMYPELTEGKLSKLRSNIVNENTLSRLASHMELDKFILLGKGELKEGGLKKSSILCNVFESLLGAVFMQNGYDKACEYLEPLLMTPENQILWDKNELDNFDAKSKLQEVIMQEFKKHPEYKSSEVKIENEKKFKIQFWIGEHLIDELVDVSKKKGMQKLAKTILNNKSYQRILNVN